MFDHVYVAAYQGTPASHSYEQRFEQVYRILAQADEKNVDFICFPEGFLTGYFDDETTTRSRALSVYEPMFQNFVAKTAIYRVTLIIGFTERDGTQLFDAAAVIEQGILLGVQRKHYQYHSFITSSDDYQVFISKGIRFGIIICLDANYFEPARICALQGTTLLFVPTCNKVDLVHPYAQRPSYYSHFIARAYENRCWLIAADWIWPNDGSLVCPGHSVVYNPNGIEVARSKEGVEELVIVQILTTELFRNKGRRVYGSQVLQRKLALMTDN